MAVARRFILTNASRAKNSQGSFESCVCLCRCCCARCPRASRRRCSRLLAASTRRRSTHLSAHSRTRQVTWPSRCPPPASCSRLLATSSAPRCLPSRLPRHPASLLYNECHCQTGYCCLSFYV